MAKASGDRRSRSERKAGRERVQRAREHGLPEPRPQAPSASARFGSEAAPEDADVTSTSPAAATAARKSAPVLVWVLGAALAILLIAYVITHFRDSGSP